MGWVKKTVPAALAAAAALVLAAPEAHALDMEFYTYGGFEAVRLAFQRTALVFSDAGYQALFFVIITMGIFFGAASTYFRLLSGQGRGGTLAWAWPVGLGVCLYLALVVPKGSLYIYDPVLNRQAQVTNVPNGLVAIAGVLNRVERGLVEILETSGGPETYLRSGGSVGVSLLYNVASQGRPTTNPDLFRSSDRYVEDCVMFELVRPGTDLTEKDLLERNELAHWAKAASPAIYTVYYDGVDPRGTAMTCQAAWALLEPNLQQPVNYEQSIRRACADAGFDPGQAQSLQTCRALIADYVNYTMQRSDLTETSFAMQRELAYSIDAFVRYAPAEVGQSALASQRYQTGGAFLLGSSANRWFTSLRAVCWAIALGLTPFVALMIPTGLVGTAISLLAGFFVWLTAWGITDVVTNSFSQEYAFGQLQSIRESGLGYASMMHLPDRAESVLNAYGYMRTASVMLATVIATALVKFGGHAMALLAGNMMGRFQSTFDAGVQGAGTAEGVAGTLHGARQGLAAAEQYTRISAHDEAKLSAAGRISDIQGGLGAMERTGGFSEYLTHQVRAAAGRSLSGLAHGEGALAAMDAYGGGPGAVGAHARAAELGGVRQVEDSRRFDAARRGLGLSQEDMAYLEKNQYTADEAIAQKLRDAGHRGIAAGMQLSFSVGEGGEIVNVTGVRQGPDGSVTYRDGQTAVRTADAAAVDRVMEGLRGSPLYTRALEAYDSARRQGLALTGEFVYGSNGEIAGVRLSHGASVVTDIRGAESNTYSLEDGRREHRFDTKNDTFERFSSRKTGWRNETLAATLVDSTTDIRSGRSEVHTDKKLYDVDRGVRIGNAPAVLRDFGALKAVVAQGISHGEDFMKIAARDIGEAVYKDVAAFAKQEGVTMDEAAVRVGSKLGFGIGPLGAAIDGHVGGGTSHRFTADTLRSEIVNWAYGAMQTSAAWAKPGDPASIGRAAEWGAREIFGKTQSLMEAIGRENQTGYGVAGANTRAAEAADLYKDRLAAETREVHDAARSGDWESRMTF